MNQIKEFKQLFMLETYSKHSYIFEADKAEILDNLIETNKFITVSGARINVTNISSYYPIPNNPLYNLVTLIPESTRAALLGLIKEYDSPDYGELKERKALNFLRKKYGIPTPDIKNYPNKSEGSYLTTEESRHYVCEFLYSNYPNNE